MTLGLIAGVGVAALGGLLLIDRTAAAFLRPRSKEGEPAPDLLAGPLESVIFPSSDGLQLRGWFIPAEREGEEETGTEAVAGTEATGAPGTREGRLRSAPPVVLAHGWTGTAGRMLPLARALASEGVSSLTFDVRGHGRSDPARFVTARHFRDDVSAAVDWLFERTGERPVVVGHSMGGSAAILAAVEGAPVAGLVLLAAPADIMEVTAGYFAERGLPGSLLVRLFTPSWRLRAGVPFPRLHPAGRVGELRIPLHLVQGDSDLRVPPAHAHRLASLSGAPLEALEGVDHREVITHPRTVAVVMDFLGRVGEGATEAGAAGPATTGSGIDGPATLGPLTGGEAS